MSSACTCFLNFFFFNDTATTEIYTLSLHDALPIFVQRRKLTFARAMGVGVLGGLCFTANDRWYAAFPILVLTAMVLDSRGRSWRELAAELRPLAGIAVGFVIPLVVFEAATVAPLWIAHDARVQLP